MAAHRTTHAEWALLSKPPEDSGDYRILACSRGPSWAAQFEVLVLGTLFGTPSQWTTAGAAAENLPWISFGVARDPADGARRLSVSVGEWLPHERASWDSVGRRPVAVRYFAVGYEHVAAARGGLLDLWEAVRPLELPPPATSPGAEGVLPLRLPEDPLPRLARLIDDSVGFEWAAHTAAALLAGPVGLVAHTSPFAQQRIGTMDAVLGLLPYGYRASMTCATWAPEPRAAEPWLCYTHPGRTDGRRLVHEGAVPTPLTGTAGRHLERVRRLRERAGTLGALRALASFTRPEDRPGGAEGGPRWNR
ncbi:hypothetical protein ACF1AO_32490 [Streptomyces longwoodensis]|uniref:hypothetical protein n=1 Tax=Streptomyces longwoodensis TaxID=68231 RepID=UPI0036F82F8B